MRSRSLTVLAFVFVATVVSATSSDVARCRQAFDFASQIDAIDSRMEQEIAKKKPGVPFNAIQKGMLAYTSCRAIAQQRPGTCSQLDSIKNFGSAPAVCGEIYSRLIFWVQLDSKPTVDPNLPECAQNSRTTADSFCQAASDAWKRRSPNFCAEMASRSTAQAAKGCPPFFRQITAKSFKPLDGQQPWEIFDQWVIYNLWNKTAPRCDTSVPLGNEDRIAVALREGACVGVFDPSHCESLIEPLKDYACGR